jgi:spermidine synthase
MSWMGFFYGGNIAGGVTGCLLAGFYLLRVYDMAIATYVAVVINVIVAGLGLMLAGSTAYEVEADASPVNGKAAKAAAEPVKLPGS